MGFALVLGRGPKSVYIRLYPETDDLCPSVEAYIHLGHGHRPIPHPREKLVEGEAGDLIPSLPFAKAGFGEEDARGTCIVLPCNYGLVRSLPVRFYT